MSEHAVGVTQFDKNGRLPFPTLLPLDGKPLVMAVGALKPGAKPSLAVIVDKDGQRSLVTRTADGKTRTQKLSDKFKSNPATLAIQDVNQDGLADLVVLIPYEKIKVLIAETRTAILTRRTWTRPAGRLTSRGWRRRTWTATASRNCCCRKKISCAPSCWNRKPRRRAPPTSRMGLPCEGPDQRRGGRFAHRRRHGGDERHECRRLRFSCWTREYNQLTLCERDPSGVWRVVRNINLPVSGFNGLRSVALGGTNVQSVAFLGQNAVAWMPLAGDVWAFTTLDGYDTPIKDGYLNDVVAGDLSGNGRKDLVFLETAKNNLDIVSFDSHHKLVPAIRWQVFEAHTFRGVANALPEPREALVTDVTGNGKHDLVVLVHDRILVYPQE